MSCGRSSTFPWWDAFYRFRIRNEWLLLKPLIVWWQTICRILRERKKFSQLLNPPLWRLKLEPHWNWRIIYMMTPYVMTEAFKSTHLSLVWLHQKFHGRYQMSLAPPYCPFLHNELAVLSRLTLLIALLSGATRWFHDLPRCVSVIAVLPWLVRKSLLLSIP